MFGVLGYARGGVRQQIGGDGGCNAAALRVLWSPAAAPAESC